MQNLSRKVMYSELSEIRSSSRSLSAVKDQTYFTQVRNKESQQNFMEMLLRKREGFQAYEPLLVFFWRRSRGLWTCTSLQYTQRHDITDSAYLQQKQVSRHWSVKRHIKRTLGTKTTRFCKFPINQKGYFFMVDCHVWQLSNLKHLLSKPQLELHFSSHLLK